MDRINTKILQITIKVIGEKILHVTNNSLQKETFPSSRKKSTVVLIDKKVNTIKVTNLD